MFELFPSRRGDAQPSPRDGSLERTGRQPPACVGSAEELGRLGRLVVEMPQWDVALVVVSTRRGLFAFGDSCPHAGAPLDYAAVAAATVTCLRHSRRYSLKSGRCVSALGAAARLRRWRAWLEDGHVWIGEEMT